MRVNSGCDIGVIPGKTIWGALCTTKYNHHLYLTEEGDYCVMQPDYTITLLCTSQEEKNHDILNDDASSSWGPEFSTQGPSPSLPTVVSLFKSSLTPTPYCR